MFSIGETAVGLVCGSLPAIGSRFHLYGSTRKRTQIVSSSARLGDRTFGGTPFTSLGKCKDLYLTPRGHGHTETRIWSNFESMETDGHDLVTRVEDDSP